MPRRVGLLVSGIDDKDHARSDRWSRRDQSDYLVTHTEDSDIAAAGEHVVGNHQDEVPVTSSKKGVQNRGGQDRHLTVAPEFVAFHRVDDSFVSDRSGPALVRDQEGARGCTSHDSDRPGT